MNVLGGNEISFCKWIIWKNVVLLPLTKLFTYLFNVHWCWQYSNLTWRHDCHGDINSPMIIQMIVTVHTRDGERRSPKRSPTLTWMSSKLSWVTFSLQYLISRIVCLQRSASGVGDSAWQQYPSYQHWAGYANWVCKAHCPTRGETSQRVLWGSIFSDRLPVGRGERAQSQDGGLCYDKAHFCRK